MKTRLFLLYYLLIILISTSSCVRDIYMIYAGMHKPRVETTESLYKYMRSKKMTANNVFTTCDFKNFQKQYSYIGGGVPDVLIFNKKLENIIYRAKNECNAHAFGAISDLKKDVVYQVNDTIKFEQINRGLCDLSGVPTYIKFDKDADFLVVIYWAKYIGMLNKDHVKVWEKDAMNNKNAKIQVVKINLDMQSFWNLN